MTKAELLGHLDAGLLVEARNGLLKLRLTDVDAHVTAAHASVRVRLVDMHAEQPNPHRAGTFLWAGHEYEQGHTVARKNCTYCPSKSTAWLERCFCGEDFYATDWRVAQ